MNQNPPKPNLPRRDFLRFLGLLASSAGLSAFLQACEKAGLKPNLETVTTKAPYATSIPPTSTAVLKSTSAPPPSAEPKISTSPEPPTATAVEALPSQPPGATQVVLVKTEDRSEGVRKAIDLLDPPPISEQDVFLKPNFNSADPTPGSTHPEVLRTLVLKLRDLGAARIIVGDRSGMGDTRQVMQSLGVFEMAQELSFEPLVLDELGSEEWVMNNPSFSHWSRGFPFVKVCLDCGAVVQTCCLKTHRFGGHFSMSLKNSVGLVAKRLPGEDYNYMNELHGSPDQRIMIAEINTAYRPTLILLDGLEAFVNGGPDRGEQVHPGVILAGSDRIAMDAVGVAILRAFGTTAEVANGPIFQLEQIARAAELGIGITRPDLIEFRTPDDQSRVFADQILEILNHA